MLTKKQTLTLLSYGSLFLVCVPLIALAIGWQWSPPQTTPFYLFPLYLATETGTLPQVFITCAILAGIPLLYIKPTAKKAMILILIMAFTIATGQVVKSALKNLYQEPRPYTVWLEKESYIAQENFYQLSRKERSSFITQQDFTKYNIPNWQQNHWSKETGYSFPSGHTIFVAQWLLMYLLLFWRRKAYLPLAAVAIWALTIEASRLLLGMHWGIDILVSCVLASFISIVTQLCWQRFVFKTKVQ